MTYLIRTHFYLFISLITVTAQAQNVPLFAGTKTPYPVPAQQYTPPPPGFAPIFVNHVGRHGARFFTKAGSDVQVLKVLQADLHSLTPLGRELVSRAQHFVEIQKGNYENISGLGKEEQALIGNRMRTNYKEVFTGKGLEIYATHKVRTQQSANAFLDTFAGYAGKKDYKIMPDSLDTLLRFYDLSPAYRSFKASAAVQQPVDSLINDPKTKQLAKKVCSRIFTHGFKKDADAVAFVIDLYDVYSGQFSVPVEMKQKGLPAESIDCRLPFKEQELQWFAFINGAADFLEKGAARDTLGIQATVAAPLLADFINSTGAVIDHHKQADAILRFTHAEAISPFATLLGIPQASVPAASIYQYDKHWSAENIIPLSANIQWIVYSNGSDYLVKVLLNEKEVALPVATKQYPYYKWEAIKEYYLKKLNQLKS